MLTAKPHNRNIKTKTIWAAIYWDHCNMIMFFSDKPKITEYTELDNRDLIIGDMSFKLFEIIWDCDFSKYLRPNGHAKYLNIEEVFQIEITAHFDEYGRMIFNAGGW